MRIKILNPVRKRFIRKHFQINNNLSTFVLKIKITGGGNGECLAEFTVAPEHLNRMGGLHGGFTATVVDNMTTCALLSKEPAGLPGVSVDLHVR